MRHVQGRRRHPLHRHSSPGRKGEIARGQRADGHPGTASHAAVNAVVGSGEELVKLYEGIC